MYPTDPLPPQAMATNSFLKMIVGFWMGLVGVGLEQARLFYLIPAAVGVVAVYLTTRHLYGSVAGLAALAIAAYIPLVHTYARADVFLPSMTAVGLYFLVTARSTGARWRHYLAGLTVCFSIEGHHYGVCMVAAFGLIYLFDYARQIRLARHWQWSPAFCFFVLGCLTFAPFYLYVHFFIVPGGLDNIGYLFPVYSTQVTLFSKESYPVRILNANWTMYRLFVEFAPLEALVGLLGVLAAFLRRNNADRLMLSILGLFLVIWALLLAHGSFYYRIFFFPFVAIFGGALIAQLAGLLKEHGSQIMRLNFAGIAGVSLISVLFISNTINTFLYRQSADEFTEIGRKLDRVLPPDITIAGAPPFYFGMPTRRGFVSAETFDDKPPEAWGLPAPSVIILTRHVDDQRVTIQNYLKQHNFAKRYCFSISLFGGESVVYQLPSIPIDNTLPKCNEN